MSVISWLTDPLLYDEECTPMNEWLTANKLLEAGQGEKIFADKNSLTLNLYPILVRRVDFIRENDSDRVLSRFPFLVLTDEEKVLIKSKILLIAEFARDYFYRSITSGIMDWKRRLQIYLKRGAMPYPLYRCACEILNLPLHHFEVDELFFESARGKQYSIPTKLTNAIAYLCGVINGDGHLQKHWLRVTDETKEHILLLSKLFEQLFHDPGEIFLTGNAWNVELRSANASRLFNFLTDHTIEGAKYDSLREPLLFQELGSPFRNLYWRGAMDADGSVRNQITFSSTSESYSIGFQSFLESINIASKLKVAGNETIGLYILAKDKMKFVNSIGLLNSKKSEDLLDYLQRKRKYATYMGMKKNVLTLDGYYNLDLLDSLFISGLGDFLKEYRADRNYTAMDELFEIAHNSYSRMENNNRGLPYSILKKIVNDYYNKKYSVYNVLEKNESEIRFQVANSNPIKLPLKPNKKLEFILPFLSPKISYVLLKKKNEKIKTIIKELFDITVSNPQISCRLLLHFLQTYYVYTTNNPTLTVKEFYEYKKKWREEIFQ